MHTSETYDTFETSEILRIPGTNHPSVACLPNCFGRLIGHLPFPLVLIVTRWISLAVGCVILVTIGLVCGMDLCCEMDYMDLAGYLASLLIGVTLGLIGGGGSILTVPVLVFLFRVSPVTATAYSLFIVGSTSLVGTVPKFKEGSVNLRAAIAFGLPSLAAVFMMRTWVVPHLPEQIGLLGDAVSRDRLLLLLFAFMMVVASLSLVKQSRKNASTSECSNCSIRLPLVIGSGLLEGSLTGLVGAGGGFLIIPALVLLNKVPMKQAIGTSLLIIATKSLVGFTGDLSHFDMDWSLLLTITAIAIAGIFIGSWLSTRINGNHLKKGFGWFVFAMGVYIALSQFL